MPKKENQTDVVVINLDRARELRFGHKALKLMMSETGLDINNLKIEQNNLEMVEKVMYYGLLYDARQNGEELKLEQMEDLLDHARTYNEIMDKIAEALEVAFGVVEEDTTATKN